MLGPKDFVLGPKSDYDLSGQEITAALATKGYALVKLIVAEEDAAAMLDTWDGRHSRSLYGFIISEQKEVFTFFSSIFSMCFLSICYLWAPFKGVSLCISH